MLADSPATFAEILVGSACIGYKLCLTTCCAPADLEKSCRPDCILSTNTSTIDISLVGAKTSAHKRVVGAHFFSPAHVMPLLEIVKTDKTSKQVGGHG